MNYGPILRDLARDAAYSDKTLDHPADADFIIYVCSSGSDWYRQPGTKDHPLRSVWEAFHRMPSSWSGKARVVVLRKRRHRRRAELARRRANAARRGT